MARDQAGRADEGWGNCFIGSAFWLGKMKKFVGGGGHDGECTYCHRTIHLKMAKVVSFYFVYFLIVQKIDDCK